MDFYGISVSGFLLSFHVFLHSMPPTPIAPHLCRSLVMNHPSPIFNLIAHFNNCHFSMSKPRIMGLPQQLSLKIISQATKGINIELCLCLVVRNKMAYKIIGLEIGSSIHEQVAQIFSHSCHRKKCLFKRSQNEAELRFIKRFQCDFKHGA